MEQFDQRIPTLARQKWEGELRKERLQKLYPRFFY